MLRTALSTAMFLTFATNLAGCGASAADEPEGTEAATSDAEELAKQMQAVQWDAGGHFQLDMTQQSQVEGFLMYRGRDGAYWVLCGITFVSHHFGITAGHCVTQLRPDLDNFVNTGDDTIIVAQLDARNIIAANGGPLATMNKLWAQAQVSGTWPAWTRSGGMGCNDGLCASMIDTQCRLRFRCGGQQSPELPRNDGCPENIAGQDIAMVHCPNRSTSLPYASIANSVFAGQNIDIHWYHELLNMPSSWGQGTEEQRNHYMRYDNSVTGSFGKLQNYHYVGGAQYFPFVSSSFPDGERYIVTHAGNQGTFTNAYGCHGTSGSGVFLAGTTQLIGPVLGGGTDGFLCMDPSAHVSPSASGFIKGWLSNASPSTTRTLADVVAWDR